MVDHVIQGDVNGDIFPLMDDNGAGSYIKGRNTITEWRTNQWGLFYGKTGNSPASWRPGVIAPGSHIGGDIVDFQVQATGTPGTQAVHILAGRIINTRSGQGAYMTTNLTNAISVPMPAADGSNPRIDLVCVMPYDKGQFVGDAVHGPKFIVVRGDPSSSPAVPALPAAVADAQILARILRGQNDNTIAPADVTDVRKSAGIHGTPRVLLPGDLTADAGSYHGELRMRVSNGFNLHVPSALGAAGAKVMIDYWDAVNNTWRGISPGSIRLGSTTFGAFNNVPAGGAEFAVVTTAIPDPGYPYRLRIIADLTCHLNPGTAFVFRVRDGALGGTALINGTAGFLVSRNGDPAGSGLHGRVAYPEYSSASILTGARNVILSAHAAHADGAGVGTIPALGNVAYEIVPA